MTVSIADVMDVRLPDSVEARTQGIRTFKTRVFETDNGFEPVRRVVWPDPRRSWVIESIPVDRMDKLGIDWLDIDTVIAIFECAKGSAYPFKYKPWDEHEVSRAQGTLAYNADLGGYPLRKVYSAGGRTATRRINLLDTTETYTVWVNSVITAVTINANGVITSLPTSGVTVEWQGSFLVPVRFEDDTLEDDVVGQDQTLALPSIKLREVLFP